jgi:protease PrsW
VTAGLIEYQTLQRLDTLPTIAIALAEETAKLMAPLAILVFTRHRRPADGLLIGVACGAGFAVMETMGYSAVALVQSPHNPAAVEGLLLQRGLFSPATHMAWTGLTAAALWHAALQRWRLRPVALLAACFATAIALHTAWDSAGTIPAYLVIAAASLTLLAVTSHRLRRAQPSAGGRGANLT